MNQNRRRVHLAVLAGYAALTVLLTWPLTRVMTTHVAGNAGDDPALAWNLWWIKARLVDQLNFDIFHADWMFFPIEINLGFYTLTPLNGLLSIPLQSAFTLIFASNLLLFGSYIVGGYGTFLLVLHLLGQNRSNRLFDIRCAAILAGLIYAFASSKLFYAALGQFNIASSHWIPFCILYLMRINPPVNPPVNPLVSSAPHPKPDRRVQEYPRRDTQIKNVFFAGLFLILQAWSELTYASFLLIFIAVYFVWLQLRKQSVSSRLTLLRSFILMGLLFLVGLAPFLWAMIPDMLREGDFFASGGGFADTFSADLFGYLIPTKLHPFLGKWVETLPFDKNLAQQIYIGYVGLGLALLGAFAYPRSKRTTSGRPSVPQPNSPADPPATSASTIASASLQQAQPPNHPTNRPIDADSPATSASTIASASLQQAQPPLPKSATQPPNHSTNRPIDADSPATSASTIASASLQQAQPPLSQSANRLSNHPTNRPIDYPTTRPLDQSTNRPPNPNQLLAL